MLVTIIRSLPGAGKSTLAKKLCKSNGIICSADEYFIDSITGEYKFDGKMIGAAHDWCFSEFNRAIDTGIEYIVIDNTNTRYNEFSRYIRTALANGYDIEIIEPNTSWKHDIEQLVEKNTHGVPRESIQKMMDRWEDSTTIYNKIKQDYLDYEVVISGGAINVNSRLP